MIFAVLIIPHRTIKPNPPQASWRSVKPVSLGSHQSSVTTQTGTGVETTQRNCQGVQGSKRIRSQSLETAVNAMRCNLLCGCSWGSFLFRNRELEGYLLNLKFTLMSARLQNFVLCNHQISNILRRVGHR